LDMCGGLKDSVKEEFIGEKTILHWVEEGSGGLWGSSIGGGESDTKPKLFFKVRKRKPGQ